MIEFNINEIRDLCSKAHSEIDEIEDTVEKFKVKTNELLDNNEDENVFVALEEKMEELLPRMQGLILDDIEHVFNYIERAMDVVEEVDKSMMKGIDINEN